MPTRPPRTATPIAFIQAIAWGYARRGQDPADALARAQIAPELLRDPEARVTSAQMERFSALAMQQLDDEALGWFRRRLPWGSYGMLARASISAPDLGLALKRWCRHHGLLTEDLTLNWQGGGGIARLRITEHRPLGRLREFCLVTLLRNVHGLACWLVDQPLPLVEVRFPFAAPRHAEVYPLLFPGPVQFEAGDCGLDIEARWLALPLQRDEAALQQMLQRALPLMVRPYRGERRLAHRVQQLLRQRPDAACSAAALAEQLHVSVRSLHRRLAEEGRPLQALKDAARRERAIELLCRSRRPVKQVALAVGFASEKSFARAFRQWTGCTPSAMRAAGREQPAPPG